MTRFDRIYAEHDELKDMTRSEAYNRIVLSYGMTGSDVKPCKDISCGCCEGCSTEEICGFLDEEI